MIKAQKIKHRYHTNQLPSAVGHLGPFWDLGEDFTHGSILARDEFLGFPSGGQGVGKRGLMLQGREGQIPLVVENPPTNCNH